MDQTGERYLESKEELQRRMDNTRHSMADTMGEIKQELSAAMDWETYVQRYPGTCLLAGGALGWAIGRKLGSLQDEPAPSFVIREALPIQPSEPSTVTRMAEMVVSSVFAQALPLFAAKMRQFLAATTHPVRE
jgi:hypothetical protein